jgi:hypothetical protein
MARSADDDRYRWKEVPATYADTFEVSVVPDAQIARIAFGEYAGRDKGSFLRVAIAMPIADARELVRILGDLIRDMDQQRKATAADG